jgi:hypothetical protein
VNLRDQAEEFIGGSGIKGTGRLVGDQDFRPRDQTSRDGDAPDFAAG